MSELTIHGTEGECFYPKHGENRRDLAEKITKNYFKFDPEGPTIEAVIKYRSRDQQQGYLHFKGDSVDTILSDCRMAIERGPGLGHLEEPDQGMKRVFWDLVIEEPEVENSLENVLAGLEELQRNVLIDMLYDDSESSMGFTIDSTEIAKQLVRAMISAERSVALRRNSLASECDMELKFASQSTKIAYVEDSERRVSEKIDERLEDQRRSAYTDLQDAVANLNHLQTSPRAVADVTSQVFSEFYPKLNVGIDNVRNLPDTDDSSDIDNDSVSDDSMTIDIDTEQNENKNNRTELPLGPSLPIILLIVVTLIIVAVGGLIAAGVLPGMSLDDPGQSTLSADQSGPNQFEVSAAGFEPGNYSVVATSENDQYETNNFSISDSEKIIILLTDVGPGSYDVRLRNTNGNIVGSTNIKIDRSENASTDTISVQVDPPGTVVFDLNDTNATDYSYIIMPTDGNGSTIEGNFTSLNTDGTRNVTIENPTPGKEYNVRLSITSTGETVVETTIQLSETTNMSRINPISAVMVTEHL